MLKGRHRGNIYSSKVKIIKIVTLSTEWIYSQINYPMKFIHLVTLYDSVMAVENAEI